MKTFRIGLLLSCLLSLAAGVLFYTPVHPPWLQQFDRWLFAEGQLIAKPRESNLQVAVVTVPESSWRALSWDFGNAKDINNLLNKAIVSNQPALVAIVLDQPLQTEAWADQAVRALKNANNPLPDNLRFGDDVRRNLLAHLRSGNVVLGVQASATEKIASLAVTLPADYPGLQTPPLPIAKTIAANEPIYWPVASNEFAWPLVWQLGENENRYVPGLTLALFQRLLNLQSVALRDDMLVIDNNTITVGAGGRVLAHQLDSSRLRNYSLVDALANPIEADLILLGNNTGQLNQIARTLISLESASIFTVPSWQAVFSGLSLLVFLLLGLLLFPRLSLAITVLSSCLLALLLIIFQVLLQATQWQYISVSSVLVFLLLVNVVLLFQRRYQTQLVSLRLQADEANQELAQSLLRHGRADEALVKVNRCATSERSLALLYDIAGHLEQKRQYAEALSVYQNIVSRKKNYRDSTQKIDKLSSVSGSHPTVGGGGLDESLAKTLMVSESAINNPVIGRYEIQRELGRGAMGIVYLARDPKITRDVAIKTLSYSQFQPEELANFKDRFFREAAAAGRLNHPNIVAVYDVGEEHDLAFIAMDYVPGYALNRVVHKANLLPVDVVCKLIADAASALDYAHSKKVVHRDIKPGNLLYEPETKRIKIADFGVARIVDSAKTSTGELIGSPLYMSPEQLRGTDVGPASDIYSLGVTLYQLLSGELPFKGDSLAALTYSIINDKPKGVREHRQDLPTTITRIINKALAKDPARRFASAEEFAKTLRRLIEVA